MKAATLVLATLSAGLQLAGCSGGAEAPAPESAQAAIVSGYGLAIELPAGWNGRVVDPPGPAGRLLQAQSFPRPGEDWIGPETAAAIGETGVVIEVADGGPVGPVGVQQWQQTTLPIQISRVDLGPFEGIATPAEAVRWLVIDGRGYLVTVGFGVVGPTDALLAQANRVLATLRIAPPRDTPAVSQVDGVVCAPGEWPSTASGVWVRAVLGAAGLPPVDCTGSAFVVELAGRDLYVWATGAAGPVDAAAELNAELLGSLAGVRMLGSSLRAVWQAQGLNVWVEAGPTSDRLPAFSALRPLMAASLGLRFANPEAGVPASDGVSPGPAGTLYLASLREPTLTVVDVASGQAREVPAPIAPGDPPYALVRTGGKLVVYGGGHTYALDLDLRSPPRDLGESWYFVPSAAEGRVWLLTLDPESPETVRDLLAAREVAVDGRVTVPTSGRPPSHGPAILAAVRNGLLYQERGRALALWNPATGELTLRLPGAFPADTHGNLVAWCDKRCSRFHITDAGTGEDTAIPPGEGFRFEATYEGAFSPDGSLLALPVLTSPATNGEDNRRQVALVDVKRGTARLVEGPALADDYPLMAWSSTGDWLFFAAGAGRIMAYQPGTQSPVLLPVPVEGPVVAMEAR